MTLDEVITQAMRYEGRYKPEEITNFASDPIFMDYLRANYCDVYDFVVKCNVKEKLDIPIAAITIGKKSNTPTLFLHPHRITFMFREMALKLGPGPIYEAFACILWHESLHVTLKHFRVPFQGYSHNFLNVAQDMVIDNLIHQKCQGWRDWQGMIDEINAGLSRNKSIMKPIDNAPDSPTKILNQTDLFIYTYLKEACVDVAKTKKDRFDDHEWSKEGEPESGDEKEGKDGRGDSTPEDEKKDKGDGKGDEAKGKDSGGNVIPEDEEKGKGGDEDKGQDEDKGGDAGKGEDEGKEENEGKDENEGKGDEEGKGGGQEAGKTIDDFLDDLAKSAAERNSKNKDRSAAEAIGALIGDMVLEKTAQGRDHNLYNLLKKYIKVLSAKNKQISWKKVSRKQPGRRPGILKKTKPGQVVLIIDTSGSMAPYLKNSFEDTLYGIYSTFSRIARVYGMPSIFNKIEVDDSAPRIEEIGGLEELKKMKLSYGGGTNYEPAFEVLMDKWKKETKAGSNLPDFVLFISDFDCSFNFLSDVKYRKLDRKLIWIYTGYPGLMINKPPIGTIVHALADDWLASAR